MHTSLERLDEAVFLLDEALRPHLDKFQSVVCTGLSGIVPASVFCHRHHKNLVVVRKPGEACHGSPIEGSYNWQDTNSNYVVVDDFVGSGRTIQRLLDARVDEKEPLFVVLYGEKMTEAFGPYEQVVPPGQRRWELVPVEHAHRCLFTVHYHGDPVA